MFLDDEHFRIRYDCPCHEEFTFKRKYDAEKNFKDNGEKHICRQCKKREKWANLDAKGEILRKMKWTSRERWGVDHPMQTEEGLDAMKAGHRAKHGVDFPLQTEEAKQKCNETWWANKGRPWRNY